jgi:DNA-binding NarL/FixJ family response regulator
MAHGLEDPAARGHLAIHVSMDRLEGFRRDALLCDTPDTEDGYRTALDLQLFERKLNSEDLEIYRMLKAGYCWHEIGERIGRRPNTIHRRFSRTVRRINGSV